MKSVIINTSGKLGGYQFARLVTAKQPKILMYHRFTRQKDTHSVCEATFEQHLRLIKKYFTPMTLTDLATATTTHKAPPKHAVVITVDDGYRDFYEVAYPLLKHYRVPATFFVTTGFVNKDLWLWPDQVTWILNNKVGSPKVLQVGNKKISLTGAYSTVWWDIVGLFLSIPNADRLKGISDLSSLCGVTLPEQAPKVYAASTWQQLAEMQESGIEIGGHTVSHPSLGHMSVQEAEWEISESLRMLSDNLGAAERSFCFPNGQPEDYSEKVKSLVARCGYTAAVTAFSDKFNIQLPYAWRRFVGCEESFQFHKSLFGVEHLGNRLRKTTRCTY